MMLFLKKWSPVSILLFLIMASGCREDLSVNNNDQFFPLTLRTEAGNDKVQLSWDRANVSTFEKYVLVRSRSPIPVGLRPTFSSGDFEIVMQTDDPDSLSFRDDALPVVEELYYKVYVGFNDRFAESDAVKIGFDNLLIDGNGGVAKFIPGTNWIILGDEFTQTLSVVDYQTKQTLVKRSVSFTNSDNMCLDVAVENGQNVLYWWAGYNNFFKFTLPDLNQIGFWSVPFSGFSVLAGDDKIYTTQYDYNQSFTVRRKNDMSVVEAHYRTDYYTHRTLAYLDKGTNLMVEASPYRVLVYNVNSTTGSVSNLREKTTNTFSVFNRDLPVSNNGQYFIPQFDGLVYDRNLNQIGNIPLQNGGYTDAEFSQDDEYLYVLSQDFAFGGSLITKFKFPSMDLVATKRFNNVSPRVLNITGNGVIFVGNGVNGLNKVLVKKLEF